jgi:hypothetical protein
MTTRRSLLRFWSLLALVASAGTVLGSCNSLFGFDDYHDSTKELCDLLSRCYGFEGCESRIGGALESASADDRATWLASMSIKSCLAQCSKARKCLNIEPVCGPVDAACTRKEDCCGFLTGEADCRLSSPASPNDAGVSDAGAGQTTCCKADGTKCDAQTESQCCSGACRNGRCGGVFCRLAGQVCSDDYQCCTGKCESGICFDEVCIEAGMPCDANDDRCCIGTCTTSGTCGFEQCVPLHGPCDPTPGAAIQCCQNPGGKEVQCKLPSTQAGPTTPNLGQCLEIDENPCSSAGEDCNVGADCCPNEGLSCNPSTLKCGQQCAAPKNPCQFNSDCCSGACNAATKTCDCSTSYCSNDGDCCSANGKCYGGVCLAQCAPPSCTHDECLEGAPLDEVECGKTGAPADPKVVAGVCAADPYCCCNAWDLFCVAAALTQFGPSVCQ